MRTPSGLFYPHALSSLFLALTIGACGGGDVSLPPDGQPAFITVIEGDAQSGRVGEPLAEALVVQVTDSRGRPVEGATVAFEFGGAGPGASVVPETKPTNGDGLADARLVLGTTIGRQSGRAVVVSTAVASIETPFSATALSENANSMAAAAGQDQTGHVSQPLDDRLVVEVRDGFDNPVAGVPITWTAVGGGSVSEPVVPTDQDGRSRVDRILGPAVGPQSTEAASEGLAGSPVVFLHTAVAGDASRLTVVSGSDQTAAAGTLLPEALVARLVDSEGNGVPNTAVTWVVATGAGSSNPQNTVTDADGRTSTQWTLGAPLGEQRLDAVVSGVGVASFRATAVSAAPPSLFIQTQPSGSARNGVRLSQQPVVQLRDGAGNDLSTAGVQVIADLGGGGELEGTTRQNTDAFGRASFNDLAISGSPGPRTLVFRAAGYAQVTSARIDLLAVGTTTTITADSPDPSGVGTPFIVGFRVTSLGPTPTGSVTVGDGVQSCVGTLTNGVGSCQLALTSAGNRTLTATYSGVPGLSGSSATEEHTVTAAPPPPPSATATTITGDNPDPSVSGETFTVNFQVTSSAGTPTGSVTLTVSDASSTCTGNLSGGTGSCELVLTTVGARTLTASYSGAEGFSPSSDTEGHLVTAPAPPPNQPPNAGFTVSCTDLNCQFTDASGDPDGNTTITRSWDFGDGTPASNELNPSHTYAQAGRYTVRLTVTDNGGLSDDASDGVNPTAPNQAPTAEFTFDCKELRCNFDDRSTDDDHIESRAWSFGDGTTSDEKDPRHDYLAGGTYQVTLAVTDNDGARTSVTHSVTVQGPPENQGPTAEFSWQCTELRCEFDDESSDPDGRILTRAWNFGDGNTSDGEKPRNDYLAGGTYQVTLTVTDEDGATAPVTHSITVQAPPPQPASTTTEITSDTPEPSVSGSAVTVSFRVSSGAGTPTGSVTVGDGTASCTGDLSGGSGSCQLTLSTVGDRTLTADYSGAPGFQTSSDAEGHTVSTPPPASTSTRFTGDNPDPADPGQGFTVAVSGGGFREFRWRNSVRIGNAM